MSFLLLYQLNLQSLSNRIECGSYFTPGISQAKFRVPALNQLPQSWNSDVTVAAPQPKTNTHFPGRFNQPAFWRPSKDSWDTDPPSVVETNTHLSGDLRSQPLNLTESIND
jgi:hypothetical protein